MIRYKILTRSMNAELYRLAMSTIQLPYPRQRCRFASAAGYFYYDVVRADADVVVNVDEDAFVTDNARLAALIEHVVSNGYVNCGMPDGGVVPIRKHNPLVTNPFFNILNVAEIRKSFSSISVLTPYSIHRPEFETHAPRHLMRGDFRYDTFEPYYPFFVWLALTAKTLYLDAETHRDGVSTVLRDHEGHPFLVHSWFSRRFGRDEHHTSRIRNLYAEVAGLPATPESGLRASLARRLDEWGLRYYYRWKRRIERLREGESLIRNGSSE
jgi:hypothetical protein